MKIDLDKVKATLDEITALDEKAADRGPILILPRPASEVPDVKALRARIEDLQKTLRVKRGYKAAKGHDLPGDLAERIKAGQPVASPYDLSAVGVIDEVKILEKGRKDSALPSATVIVRVGFPAGEHLWFDPHDLELVTT